MIKKINAFRLMAAIYFISTSGFLCSDSYAIEPIFVSTVINGNREEIWKAISDFSSYSRWNRWVPRVDGELRVGAVVRGYVQSGNSLLLKITSIEELQELCWVDVTWFTRLGVGGWRCRSIALGPDLGSYRFNNYFVYTGPFARVLETMTRKSLESGMRLENESLKNFIESAH